MNRKAHDAKPPMRNWALRRRLDAGLPALNGWISLADPFTAEILASQGWDSVTIDRQHGRSGPGGLWELALAVAAWNTSPLIRIPHLDESQIMQALDAGFEGVICPMIDSVAQAEELVTACHFPPVGTRSFGPTRAGLGMDGDFMAESNSNIICLAMIETKEALEDLEEIVGVEGLDGIYVGPADLAISRGQMPKLDDEDPGTSELMGQIARTARSAGKFAGIHCGSVTYAGHMVDLGFHLVTVGSDVRFIRAVGEQIVAAWQKSRIQ